MGFPKYLYHRTEKPVIVKSADEEAALVGEWADTPAAFEIHVPTIDEVVKAGYSLPVAENIVLEQKAKAEKAKAPKEDKPAEKPAAPAHVEYYEE